MLKSLIADQYNSKLERVLRHSIHLLLTDESFVNKVKEKALFFLLQDGELARWQESGEKKAIAWQKTLDTLKEKNVKAVFFLTGDYAERNEKLVRRMLDEGHIIGNHGMKHASLPTLTDEQVKTEIMSLHDFVKEKYNYEMTLFRPPCGEYSEQSMAVCSELGYINILLNRAVKGCDNLQGIGHILSFCIRS